MARMADDAQLLPKQCGTSIHPLEARPSPLQDQTVKQAMAPLNTAPYSPVEKLAQIHDLYQDDQVTIREDGTTVFKLHERFAHIYCNTTARAAMANPSDVAQTDYGKDKSVIVVDCGASTTMTGSLLNCSDIEERITTVETAKDGEGMTATHSCNKTYFVRNRVGEVVTITTPAIFVRGLPQDLLSGKAVNRNNVRIILDEDSEISGLYPLDESNEIRFQDSIPFISEPMDLFYLQTEKMKWTTFKRMTGFDLWHRRLGHTPNRFIRLSIDHTKGMEKLLNKKFSEHQQCPSCMIGKSQLNDYPASIERADLPLKKVNFDVFTSSVTSIEGHNYAAVLTDDCSEYRWEYGMKTKDEMIDVSERWYAEIADLREKYQLMVVMRDNAGENTSLKIKAFFTGKGVKNYFSTPHEQWQDGLSEASIRSVLLLTKTEMAESGLAGRFWFSAATHAKNCRNVTFKQRLGTSPHAKMYGEKADVSKFRPFGCRAYVHLNKERRLPGKHTPRAVEAIHLGFASDCNMSAYKFYVPSTGQVIYSNQAKFDENFYPYRNQDMIEGMLADDHNVDILSQLQKDVTWVEFDDKMNLHEFEKVHVNTSSNEYTLRSIINPDNYMKMSRESFFQALLKQNSDELLIKARALVAKMNDEVSSGSDGPIRVKGLPNSIDPNKPPRNYRDAMSREDRQEWAAAYMEEHQGFHEQGTLQVARPEPGAKILDTTTRTDYKVSNGVFDKRKVRLCVCGNQQEEGIHYNSGNLYAPVMKASEVRLMVAIAAQNKTKLLKTDTKQAFLNGEIGDEKIYIRPPDWWPEPVPKGHALLLMKSMYSTR
jgi:hypothetical protein